LGDILILIVKRNNLHQMNNSNYQEVKSRASKLPAQPKPVHPMNTAETPTKDLFETPEQIPFEVRQILEKHAREMDGGDYRDMERILAKVQQVGYTFDYDLGGQPYDLRKIDYPISTEKRKQVAQQTIPIIREKLKLAEDHLEILIDAISDIKPTLRPYLNDRIAAQRVDVAALEIKLEKLKRNAGL